jgi:hypothetical protein
VAALTTGIDEMVYLSGRGAEIKQQITAGLPCCHLIPDALQHFDESTSDFRAIVYISKKYSSFSRVSPGRDHGLRTSVDPVDCWHNRRPANLPCQYGRQTE